MQITRRRFIEAGFCAAAGMTLSRTGSMAAAQAKTIPIGVQLYSVRGEVARNVAETLKKLSQIGYQAVEVWGYGGIPNGYEGCCGSEYLKMMDGCVIRCSALR